MIDIDKVLGSERLYDKTYKKYYQKVVDDFKVRKKLVTVRFHNGEEIKMKLSKYLVNMVLWRPFMEFKRTLTTDYLFDTSAINTDDLADYFDKIIDEFLTENNRTELNLCLAEMTSQLGYYSVDFNKRIGNTISLYDVYQLYKNNEEFRDILYTRYDVINTEKIEKDLAEKTNRLNHILGTNKNCFQDYINSKEGLNKNQETQFFINIGPKPDLKGNVFPRIVNTNFITDGMQSASDYYINSSGGRKSAITNHSKVKTSGYLMRKLSILCMNVELDNTIDDCGSQNYVYQVMDSPKTMKRYDKRFYVEDGKLKMFKFDEKTKKKMLGKELAFRSPITCACKDGKICKKCYGDLSKINFDIHVGLLAIEILTSQITQLLLSTKHLLKTSTKKIDWDENFLEVFSLNGNTIYLSQLLETPNRYSLIISEDNIFENEDGLDDEDNDDEDETSDGTKVESVKKYFRNFTIRRKIDKVVGRKYDRDYDYFEIDNGVDIYFSHYFENLLKNKAVQDDNGVYELNIKDIDKSKALFYIEIENDELSAILNSIIDLIDKKERLGTKTYNEMVNKFVELCNESNIIINSTHMEVIIRELVKSADDQLERPDFSIKDPEYQILRLSDSILNSNSVVTSLSFERIKDQIYKAKTYRKNGSSLLDDFFV